MMVRAAQPLDFFGPFSGRLSHASAELARTGLQDREVCLAFVEALDAELGCRCLSVIVYGSYAKGHFDPSSDVDFLVVTEQGSGLIQGFAGEKMLDGHVETQARILASDPSEWGHLIDGIDIANRDDTVITYLTSIPSNVVELPPSLADIAWFEKSISRMRFAKKTNSPALLPIIANIMTEYRVSYARSKGIPEDSPTGWSRMIRDNDPQIARNLTTISGAIDDSAVEAIIDCIQALISTSR